MSDRVVTALFTAMLAFGCPAVAVGLTIAFGDKCWVPRIGAIVVCMAIVVEGFVLLRSELFLGRTKESIRNRDAWLHKAIIGAMFGTLLWAFGDLIITDLYGVKMCTQT